MGEAGVEQADGPHMGDVHAPGWPSRPEEFWSWHFEAACREVDNTLFYSPDGERGPRRVSREEAAKAICMGCRVIEVCSAYAVAAREPYGTWGGLSENDRREIWQVLDPREALLHYRMALATWERKAATGRASHEAAGAPAC
jgi:WhiB family transcriptional regulator, redox-sensing transcriptional regulator